MKTPRFAVVARAAALGVASIVTLAACGDNNETAADEHDHADHDHSDHDHDHSDHDHEMVSEIQGMGSMGDPSATPASGVAGADLTSVNFNLLDSRPEGFENTSGIADVARHEGGTTVTLTLDGLDPGRQFIAHVHAGSCDENGGPHYKFDPDGSDSPPNEIHLMFKSADDGSGFMTAENPNIVGDDAASIVVHASDDMAAYIACAPLK